jgi:hypothetical protein
MLLSLQLQMLEQNLFNVIKNGNDVEARRHITSGLSIKTVDKVTDDPLILVQMLLKVMKFNLNYITIGISVKCVIYFVYRRLRNLQCLGNKSRKSF